MTCYSKLSGSFAVKDSRLHAPKSSGDHHYLRTDEQELKARLAVDSNSLSTYSLLLSLTTLPSQVNILTLPTLLTFQFHSNSSPADPTTEPGTDRTMKCSSPLVGASPSSFSDVYHDRPRTTLSTDTGRGQLQPAARGAAASHSQAVVAAPCCSRSLAAKAARSLQSSRGLGDCNNSSETILPAQTLTPSREGHSSSGYSGSSYPVMDNPGIQIVYQKQNGNNYSMIKLDWFHFSLEERSLGVT
ncbi:hypothetical protein AMTR_s00002p00154950 [Amborella trichopoda]|uniref:Uncharacterized protein n=1 Tax=Amborella trichopoda TaxID=13333 RepID=W1NZE9_AMBTC|nr:hypothetical protein AMTR_s00002p00154950 [Amborella trichopoda]